METTNCVFPVLESSPPYPSIPLSLSLSPSLSFFQCITMSQIYLGIVLSINLSIHPSIHPSTHPSIHPSTIHPSILYLSISPSLSSVSVGQHVCIGKNRDVNSSRQTRCACSAKNLAVKPARISTPDPQGRQHSNKHLLSTHLFSRDGPLS